MRVAVRHENQRVAVETWLPGETLFSLASRHHIVSCNCFSSDTCRQLFGPRSTGPSHDLPAGIDFFVRATNCRFGEADKVILERTVLPFYLPFNGKELADKAVCTMRGDRVSSLKYSLGMLLNNFRANHPLRACEVCMKGDNERVGVAYWHRMHQIPGVWCCPHHHCPLMISSATGTATGHYNWCLPRREFLECFRTASRSLEARHAEILERFAFAALGLTALAPHMFLDNDLLVQIYSERLVSLGLRETGGKLRLSDCVALVLQNSAPLRTRKELSALPDTTDRARAYVSKICWRPVVRMHPLLHVFAIVWLFDNWKTFWQAAEPVISKQATIHPDLTDVPRQNQNSSYRQHLADVMAEESWH